MSTQSSVFRKVSLDRLSSPEQLDQKLTVISPVGWVALVCLVVLIIAALAWGFLGSVHSNVQGHGMLVHGSDIVTLTSHTSGRVSAVNVQSGDFVEQGQILAYVEQEDLTRQIEQVFDRLGALDAIRVDTLEFDIGLLDSDTYREFAQLAGQIRSARTQTEAQRAEAANREQDLANQRQTQAHQVRALEERITSLEGQITEHTRLVAHQREVDLANARAQDRQHAAGLLPRSYWRDRDYTDDANLLQMRSQRDELVLQRGFVREDIALLLAAGVTPAAPEYAELVAPLRRQESTLDSQISAVNRQISLHEDRLYYQHRQEERQQAAARAAPSVYEQLRRRPDYDPTLAQMQSQMEDLRLQLLQARIQEAHLVATPTGFIWGGYNQTADQVDALTEQFAGMMVVRRQDYLRQLDDFNERLARDSVIRASERGVVAGMYLESGGFVQPGTVVGRIAQAEYEEYGYLDVILYVPVDRGMLVQAGMEVNVSPATVRREDHGYIVGQVIAVSTHAVTQEHMMSTLQNQQLVQMFGGQAPVLEVQIQLLRDPTTISGYRWSTPRGAPITISPGTISSGEIRVDSRRPIDMVVPFIRRLVMGTQNGG